MSIDIIAHRGASGLAKHENTMESFSLAIDIRADMIEFDVRQTSDHVLVVFHNEDIDGHLLKDLTYEELNLRTNKLGYQVPLFSEVLEYCQGKIRLDIEIKESGFEKKVVHMVTSLYDYDEFMIKSFQDRVVNRIKKYDSNITTGLLLGVSHGDLSTRFNEVFPLRRLKQCHADFVSPNYRLANPLFLRKMSSLGIPVYIWTVNSKRTLIKFLDEDIAGIITDRPDAALFFRKQKESVSTTSSSKN